MSVEHSTLHVAEHSQNVIERLRPLSSARRDLFIQSLDGLLDSLPPDSRRERKLWQLGIGLFGNGMTSFGSALIIVCVALIVLSVWHAQLPIVSASEFLDRAVASDDSPARIKRGSVVRQRIRVETRKTTWEHSVYRDSSGNRFRRGVKVAKQERDLAAGLALAGVNWNDPLSAASFKNWHDHQSHAADEIQRSGTALLTLTTRLPLTSIAQESLTVTLGDFHPTKRTIQYRDAGVVDISEVSMDVLSSDMANQLFAEPPAINRAVPPRVAAHEMLPSQAQMLETELQARLILNRQNADTGEQIEIIRDGKGIQVQGLVDGDERKQQLQQSLHEIPFLIVSIRSFEELKSAPSPSTQIGGTQPLSTVARVSPLEQYFMQQGRSRDDLSRISAGLFHTSLSINRSCRNLEQIRLRIAGQDVLTPAMISTRDELLTRILAQLLRDVNEQKELLDEAEIKRASVAIASSTPEARSIDLLDLAEKNSRVTRELIAGADQPTKPVEQLAQELFGTISQLRTAALQIHPEPEN